MRKGLQWVAVVVAQNMAQPWRRERISTQNPSLPLSSITLSALVVDFVALKQPTISMFALSINDIKTLYYPTGAQIYNSYSTHARTTGKYAAITLTTSISTD